MLLLLILLVLLFGGGGGYYGYGRWGYGGGAGIGLGTVLPLSCCWCSISSAVYRLGAVEPKGIDDEKQEFVKTLVRGAYAGMALCLLLPAAAAPENDNKNKSHQDAFMPGTATENDIAREVRHQLLLLPYYGVFDDIGF